MHDCSAEFTTIDHIRAIIESGGEYGTHFPLDEGRMFFAFEPGFNGEQGWCACDNTIGDCWVGWFPSFTDCLAWLYGKIDSEGRLS